MSLIDHPSGDYRFLPGIAPYSCGVVSKPGFEIVPVTFQCPMPFRRGFDRIADFLAATGRPRTALCSVSLRSPRPFSFPGFKAFNTEYCAILGEWGVFVDGVNPIARTNVAPAIDPPQEPALFGFSFTRPCPADQCATFVVAGAGELPEGVLSRDHVVALGDVSEAGLAAKARFVMGLMETRLRGLGVDWAAVNTTNIYTVHSLSVVLSSIVLPRAGAAGVHGATWHYAHPPIEDIEYEMDLRGSRCELII